MADQNALMAQALMPTVDPMTGMPIEPSPQAQNVFNKIADHYATGLYDWGAMPGRVAGTVNDGRPMPSPEDQADWAAGTAMGMVGTPGVPGGALGSAAKVTPNWAAWGKEWPKSPNVNGVPIKATEAAESIPISKNKFGAVPEEAMNIENMGSQYADKIRNWDTEALRQARANNLGFTTDAVHGTQNPFEGPALNASNGDWFFSTPNPELSNMYSHTDPKFVKENPNFTPMHAQSVPLKLNTKDYHHYDADYQNWMAVNQQAVRQAQAAGKKGVVIDNVYDEPYPGTNHSYGEQLPPQRVFITLDPTTARSPFAKFDPRSLDKNDLLAGIAGGAALPPAIATMVDALKKKDQQ